MVPDLDGIDAVVHLAGRAHLKKDNEADPLRAFRTVNVEATLNLARQAAAAGVKRFVFVSSVKVWRKAPQTPLKADAPNPQDAPAK